MTGLDPHRIPPGCYLIHFHSGRWAVGRAGTHEQVTADTPLQAIALWHAETTP